MKITILSLLTIIISTAISAQVNTEKYRKVKGEAGFSGVIQLDASIDTGNKDKQEVDAEGHLYFKKNNYSVLLVLKGEYGFANGQRFSDEALAHLRLIHSINNILDFEAFLQTDFDRSRLVLNRKLAGTGLRLNLIKREDSHFWLGLSYMYETENFDVHVSEDILLKEHAHRINSYISYRLIIKKGIRLASVFYFQPKITELSDIKMLSENSLVFDVVKNFALAIEFNIRLDNKPPDSIRKFDSRTKLGVTYFF